MTKKVLAVLVCLCTEASASSPLSDLRGAVQGALGSTVGKKLIAASYDQLPKKLLEAAGFPTEKELVCRALGNIKLEDEFKNVVCSMLPDEIGELKPTEACHQAVAFAWKQERSEEKCPGAPTPWWPFHVLHEVANKLICYELNKNKGNTDITDKEKVLKADIGGKVCKTLSQNAIDHWACEHAMTQVWERYENDCKSENGLPENELPENAEDDLGDINV